MSLQNLGKVSELLGVFKELGESQNKYKLKEFTNTSKNFIGNMSATDAVNALHKLKIETADMPDILKKMGYESDVAGKAIEDFSKSSGSSVGPLAKLKGGFAGLANKLGMSTAALGGWIAVAVAAAAGIAYLVKSAIDAEHAVEKATERLIELDEEMKQITDDVQRIASDFSSLKKSSDDVIPRFAKLAEGVNAFGENVSLTDEEYSEFLSLNNQIAEMFPEINNGMDSNGNAMLALSFSADTLTESLNELVKAQREAANVEIAKKMPEYLNKVVEAERNYATLFANTAKQKEKLQEAYELIQSTTYREITVGQTFDPAWLQESHDWLEKLGVDISSRTISASRDTSTIRFDYAFDMSKVEQNYKNALAGLDKELHSLGQQAAARWNDVNPIVSAWLQTDFKYQELNDKMQTIAKAMVSGLDFRKHGLVTEEQIKNYIYGNIIDPLFNASEDAQIAFAQITDWQTQLRNGEITAEQFTEKVNAAFGSLFDGMDEGRIDDFKTTFVNGFNSMGIAGDDFATVLRRIINEWGKVPSKTGDEFEIRDLSSVANGLKSAFDLMKTAQKEMDEQGGISVTTINALADATDNYLDYLYEENGLIKLNTEAWKKYYETEYQNSITALKEKEKSLLYRISVYNRNIDNLTKDGHLSIDDPWYPSIEKLNAKIEEANDELGSVQSSLALFEVLLNSLAGSAKETSDALERLSDIEHEISMLQGVEGASGRIIELYQKMMDAVWKELQAARNRGLGDTDDYIQELESKWNGYYNSITDLQDRVTENAKSAIDALVDYRIDMLKQDIEDEKDALDERLDDLKDFYDKQKEMLQDQYDEKKYLEEQQEKRRTVSDIQADIDMLRYDDSAWAQKRKLELGEELKEAKKELADFEEDHALDVTLDMLDGQYEQQESQLQAQMDALDDRLNDPHALFNQALADIRNNTGSLYQEFIDYNRKFGSGNDADISDIWEDAYASMLEYIAAFGSHYGGINIGNFTGYAPENGYMHGSDTGSALSIRKGDTVTVKQYTSFFETDFGKDPFFANSNPDGAKRQYTVLYAGLDRVLLGKDGQPVGYVDRNRIEGYAAGTVYASPGLKAVDELGAEYTFVSSDGSRYRIFSGGEKVLNAGATNFLYDFATSGGSILSKMLGDALRPTWLDKIMQPKQDVQLSTGNIIIQGNADSRTVSEIRREQRNGIGYILREFTRLSK